MGAYVAAMGSDRSIPQDNHAPQPFFSPLGVLFTKVGSSCLGFSALAFFSVFFSPAAAPFAFSPHYALNPIAPPHTAFIFSSLLILGLAFFCLASFFSWLLDISFGCSAGASAAGVVVTSSFFSGAGVLVSGLELRR